MAVTYVGDCPHCSANSVGMTLVGSADTPQKRPTVMFQCNRCHDIVCVILRTTRFGMEWLVHDHGEIEVAARNNGAELLEIYPKCERVSAPQYTSPVVQRAFEQGADNAKRKNMDAAASMYRKALDVATRELDPELAKKSLYDRINKLHADGRLTNDLKEWAHIIRLDGNAGAHDEEELSEQYISQLASFTELFLTYTFTLPVRVLLRKEAAEAGGATPE